MKNFLEKHNLKTENVIAAAVTAGFVLFMLFGSNALGREVAKVMWIVLLVMICLILVVLMMRAGVTIFKSLIVINVSLTLLVFLSDSYCASSFKDAQGDSALSALLMIGFLCVIYDFSRELVKLVSEDMVRIKGKDGWKKWEPILISSLFLSFITGFVAMVIHVAVPIFLNICVFKDSLLK